MPRDVTVEHLKEANKSVELSVITATPTVKPVDES